MANNRLMEMSQSKVLNFDCSLKTSLLINLINCSWCSSPSSVLSKRIGSLWPYLFSVHPLGKPAPHLSDGQRSDIRSIIISHRNAPHPSPVILPRNWVVIVVVAGLTKRKFRWWIRQQLVANLSHILHEEEMRFALDIYVRFPEDRRKRKGK